MNNSKYFLTRNKYFEQIQGNHYVSTIIYPFIVDIFISRLKVYN